MSKEELASWEPTPENQPGSNPFVNDLVALVSRVALAAIFWQSGRTKVKGYLSVTDGAVELFASEYKLPFIDPSWAAHMAAYAEHVFPVLLVMGLFTKVTAVGMLVMTAVIQVFVYPNAWPTHLSWAALMLYLVFYGPGRVSVDRFVR